MFFFIVCSTLIVLIPTILSIRKRTSNKEVKAILINEIQESAAGKIDIRNLERKSVKELEIILSELEEKRIPEK